MNRTFRTGYAKECHIYGCERGCNEFESFCEFIPVMIVPLDEAEIERNHVRGSMQFGDEPGTDPWTKRALDNPIQPLRQLSIKVNTRLVM